MGWAYQLALCINHDELSKYCKKEISLEPKQIFASESFHCCDAYTLQHILELCLATVEANIFKATIQWAKYACGIAGLDPEQVINLKMQLDDCLKSIRFGSMTIEDFHECYTPFKGLFTQDELDDIMMILNGTDAQPKIFNPTPRHHVCARIDIKRNIYYFYGCTGSSFHIKLLASFGMIGIGHTFFYKNQWAVCSSLHRKRCNCHGIVNKTQNSL